MKNPGAVAVQPGTGRVCWSARPGSNFFPVAIDGTTLIAREGTCPQGDGGLVGLDARTGEMLWSSDTSPSNESLTALAGVMVSNDQERKRLDAIDISSGKVLWSRRERISAVADTHDLVAIIVPGRGLLVLDRKTGNLGLGDDHR